MFYRCKDLFGYCTADRALRPEEPEEGWTGVSKCKKTPTFCGSYQSASVVFAESLKSHAALIPERVVGLPGQARNKGKRC